VFTGKTEEINRRAGCSLCRAGSFSWSLEEKYKLYFVFKNKNLRLDRDPDSANRLDPALDPDSSNPDSGPYSIIQ
jgi:hypothetical protein